MIVTRVEPRIASTVMLTPLLAQRVQVYAAEHQPDVDPIKYTAGIMARLWGGDAGLLALMIVDPEAGMPTGHLLADARTNGTPTIVQLRADQNVGDAKAECVQHAVKWASDLGFSQVFLNVHRDPKTWARLGFQVTRHTLRLDLAAQAPTLSLVTSEGT